MNRPLRYCAGVLLLISTASVGAQSVAKERLTFDVVSVKPNRSGEPALQMNVVPKRFMAINFPLKQFIRAAYTLQLYQIAGAPSWVDSERFDIIGLTERDLTAPVVWTPGTFAPMQMMMQSVLADRFKMTAHFEQRDAQRYDLVPRAAGSTAGKLEPTAGACPADCGMDIAAGTVRARGVPLPQLAEFLSGITGQLVVDATGLSGRFDFTLQWDPKWQQPAAEGPSLFTAVQEQLGLRLEPRRAQVPTLIIDGIARPAAD